MSTTSRPAAIVTGASRGIGAAIARALGPTHHVYAMGRDAEALGALVDELPSATAWPGDINDSAAMRTLFSSVDRLDVLVHSAGIGVEAPLETLDRDTWRASFETNLFAPAELTRFALPALREARGIVVFINSGSGMFTYPGGTLYSGTKYALRALADALREEERPHGVRVSSIHPGFVDTEMGRALHALSGVAYDPSYFVTPQAVASAVHFVVGAPPDSQIETLSIRPQVRAGT
ncbi:SDR family oxidoreductase [Microbacterium ulmi]|uniref:SDR family oxidoreductase n=1 Tax=Microbacterium ulmi TaxID=179095 RepID=A0A7Y2LZ87_9MICO|nr:SDR family oxidoreductase [Microbacterium ulmi]NII68356.1 NADP-dependent 3-hydroxy acid dehydrogenase YdfG [Microbacterium ulmi]NNH03109.1 SDR family oxidoreductase [Microbacterium ulmi]